MLVRVKELESLREYFLQQGDVSWLQSIGMGSDRIYVYCKNNYPIPKTCMLDAHEGIRIEWVVVSDSNSPAH